MPCRCEPVETPDQVAYRYQNEINKLEAILCAVLTQLELKHMKAHGNLCKFDEFIQEAEKSGQVNIRNFITKHKKDDEDRLIKELQSKFSEHELETIKRMYKGK